MLKKTMMKTATPPSAGGKGGSVHTDPDKSRIFHVVSHGARADGMTVNTKAIQAAIDACGTVVVPAGTFVTGTIWLRSHVELHLHHGAVLLASPKLDDDNGDDAYPQNFRSAKEEGNGAHLIPGIEVEDVASAVEACAGQSGSTAPIADIVIDGYRAECFGNSSVWGNAQTRPTRIRLRNIDLTVVSRPDTKVKPESLLTPVGADDARLENVRTAWKTTDPGWIRTPVMRHCTGVTISEDCRVAAGSARPAIT